MFENVLRKLRVIPLRTTIDLNNPVMGKVVDGAVKRYRFFDVVLNSAVLAGGVYFLINLAQYADVLVNPYFVISVILELISVLLCLALFVFKNPKTKFITAIISINVWAGFFGGVHALFPENYIVFSAFLFSMIVFNLLLAAHPFLMFIVNAIAFLIISSVMNLWYEAPRLAIFFAMMYILNSYLFRADIHREQAVADLEDTNKLISAQTEEIRAQRDELIAFKNIVDHDIQIATTLQNNLMERPDIIASEFTVSSLYKPMLRIGGDYISYQYAARNHTLNAFISDVSGHGVAAAFVTAMVKIALDNAWLIGGGVVLETMEILNYNLCNKIGSMYLTAFMASINFETHTLSYSNAGHCAPVLLREDGSVVRLASTGGLIGQFPDAEYSVCSLLFHPGDSLFLFTDGFFETMNGNGEMFGEETLVARAKEYAAREDFLDALFEDVRRFNNDTPWEDDIAGVYIRFIRKTE